MKFLLMIHISTVDDRSCAFLRCQLTTEVVADSLLIVDGKGTSIGLLRTYSRQLLVTIMLRSHRDGKLHLLACKGGRTTSSTEHFSSSFYSSCAHEKNECMDQLFLLLTVSYIRDSPFLTTPRSHPSVGVLSLSLDTYFEVAQGSNISYQFNCRVVDLLSSLSQNVINASLSRPSPFPTF